MKKKPLLKLALGGLLLLAILTTAAPASADNFRIIENMTNPYIDNLFGGVSVLFWMFMFVVVELGVYMKDGSVGGVFAGAILLSALFGALLPGVLAQRVFLIIAGLSFSLLVFIAYKRG